MNKTSLRLNQFKTEDGIQYFSRKVLTLEKFKVPPSSVLRTSARLATALSGKVVITSSGQSKGVLVTKTLIKAADVVPVQLVNDTEIPISIHAGHVLGYTVECDAILTVFPEVSKLKL